jgi:hypothetical protein
LKDTGGTGINNRPVPPLNLSLGASGAGQVEQGGISSQFGKGMMAPEWLHQKNQHSGFDLFYQQSVNL